jgi:hypothetical protein
MSSIGVDIKQINQPLIYTYQYDQLNRLTSMIALSKTSHDWSTVNNIVQLSSAAVGVPLIHSQANIYKHYTPPPVSPTSGKSARVN